MGEGEAGKKTKTTPDTGGKSDRADDIQEERDDNGGDDAEEDEDNEVPILTHYMVTDFLTKSLPAPGLQRHTYCLLNRIKRELGGIYLDN